MTAEDYTTYAYDPEADLYSVPFWVLCVGETPPVCPRTPMFDWIFMNVSNWGSNYACDKLSIPNSKGLAFRSYHGYQFMTVTLPKTDKEVKERTKNFMGCMRALIENHDQLWAEAKAKLLEQTEKPKKVDWNKASWFDMAQLFRERMEAEREISEIYYYFAEGLGAMYAYFAKVCHHMLGIGETDPLFEKLLAGFDSDSYQVERGLYGLSMRADQLGLSDILLQSKPEEVIPKMQKIKAGSQWVKQLHDFLHTYGWRCPLERERIFPSWVDEPSSAIGYIQKYLENGLAFEFDETLSKKARERTKLEKELIGRVPVGQRDWFKALMKVAQKYGVVSREHVYYFELCQSMTRYVLLAIGKRLSEIGGIEKPEDTIFLIPEEVYKSLSHPEACSLRSLVKLRRAAWEENTKVIPPPLIAKVSPEEVGRLILRSNDSVAITTFTGKMPSVGTDQRADLIGESVSPGVAEGPARIIFSNEQLAEVQNGDILIAPALSYGWSSVFPFVKGVVTDRGATLSSVAGVGREYGIPVVTNVINGTSKVKTGQLLRVDGNLGTVDILDFLDGKRILIVDDERDILDTLEDLLSMCDVVKASAFDQAKRLLETEHFDIAILDIMGVNGHKLLEIATGKKLLSVMLTAHALTLEDTVKSYSEGAASFLPKDELVNIVIYLNNILSAKEKGQRFWARWLVKFAPYYEKRFGPGWQNKHQEFWEMFRSGDSIDMEAGE